MAPGMQRFGGAPNNLAHYQQQQYPSHSQGHTPGLPPPSLGNPGFMNANSMSNPFAVNGNALGVGNFGGSGLGMPGGIGLASQEAQRSFAGASVHQQGHNGMGEHSARGVANKGRIREVWKNNLQEEMGNLRNLVAKYPYIAMVRRACPTSREAQLTDKLPGHGISRCCSAADGSFQWQE